MARAKKIRSIVIIGRRWHQKTYGNTYHTAEVIVNGRHIGKTGKSYGYGDQYRQSGFELIKEKYPNLFPDTFPIGMRYQCEQMGIDYVETVADVAAEKDL